MERRIIKFVAIYLRKSRGDEETALDNHRLVLSELCKENKWKYVEYQEIVSGDSVEMRPIFQALLKDIKNEIYDAVAVMDIDRLGRGKEQDAGDIKDIIRESNTLIITPQKVYDLNNESDQTFVDFKTFLARQEYKTIVKRLNQGKKIGSRQGYWTNGTPPYPYEYQKWGDKYNQKGLVVNDDKLIIYRHIIDSVTNDNKTPSEIAYSLNKQGVQSPRKGIWHSVTIYRLLLDETHLGKIISNKTKGDGHKKNKKESQKEQLVPKDQWVVVENCHVPVKTQEEHEQIVLFLSRNTNMPKRKPNTTLPLSGLIKCGICGHTMTLCYRNDRKANPESIKPCWYHDPMGIKCKNQGMLTNYIYKKIKQDLSVYKQHLQDEIKNKSVNSKKDVVEDKIALYQQLLNEKQKSLSRILDAFENGVYTLQQFKDRKAKNEQSISNIQEDINLLKIELKGYNSKTYEEKLSLINKFETDISQENLDFSQQNKLYKLIIDKILWKRIGNDVDITTVFK